MRWSWRSATAGQRSPTEAKLKASARETLDKKSDLLDKKSEQLDKKNEQLGPQDQGRGRYPRKGGGRADTADGASGGDFGYTAEQAKAELLANMESEVKHEMAQRLVELESRFKDEADDRACHIMALAIQRCAGDFVAESTISSVALPSEEMKGHHRARGTQHSEAGNAHGRGADYRRYAGGHHHFGL